MALILNEPQAATVPLPAVRRHPLPRAAVDFWVKPIRAEPLALFRILLGTVAILSVLFSLLPRLDLYLGKDGLCPPGALDAWLKKSGRFCLLRGPVSLPLLGHWLPEQWAKQYPWLDGWVPDGAATIWQRWGEEPAVAYAAFGVWLLSLLTLTLGWKTRLSAITAWALTTTFDYRLTWLTNGGDDLLRAGLFYLMLSPAGTAWSLDARRQPAALGPRLIPPWSVRLMQIQFALVYLFTGLVKLSGPYYDEYGHFAQDWLTGEAVYWVLNDIAVARWPYAWLPVPLSVCRLLSWATLAFELGFPLLVLFRRVRPWLLLAGLAFHLGIWVHTEVGWFSQVSLCWYALFLSGDGLERALRRLVLRRKGK
jgi:hypothetical protein